MDLEKTDRLPILEGITFDQDVEDDAVPLDRTAVMPGISLMSAPGTQTDFVRPQAVDLPSLAESVRSVEERITRQNAEFESLTRSFERARDAEAAAAARANALATDLAAARTALEFEQSRSRELDKAVQERASTVEAARARLEETVREAERYQGESLTLRDSLASRDATIVQTLHSLGERDAQLSALQQEHAKIVPALEATAKSSSQLEVELKKMRTRASVLESELTAARATEAALTQRLKREESQVNVARSELGSVKSQASSYLELLQTREWRMGFDQNMFRELDAQVGAASVGYDALQSERDRLRDELNALQSKLSAQSAAAESELATLKLELASREKTIAEVREQGGSNARKVTELLAAGERAQTEHSSRLEQLRTELSAKISQMQTEHSATVTRMQTEHSAEVTQMQTDAETREQESAVLMAHLQEARRPIQSIEADVKRLKEELAVKTTEHEALTEENRKLQASLERTRGALEEREFLIRRLERSESNNANVLGRIQTSIERLGSASLTQTAGGTATPVQEFTAELLRIDGDSPVTHTLARRTRIGRAAGCELQIDSTSVSRHHAMVLVGARDAIIEDLNSTNGVIVNGRKITRHLLSDGDAITIGEIQFRYIARPNQRVLEAAPPPAAT
jgi:chromosome segregation ATPase